MSNPEFKPSAFTLKADGIANQLVTEVEVMVPHTGKSIKLNAIWDTGATSSVITEDVVKALGLSPTGMARVSTANGEADQFTYIVHIGLPNKVAIPDLTVTCMPGVSGGLPILIGMDIISCGDLSITNHKGKTCMSFRIPSTHEIDYVKDLNLKVKSNINIPAGRIGSNLTPSKKKRKK